MRLRFPAYHNAVVIRVEKTCARCGQIFGAVGREYVCNVCRKRARQRKQRTAVQVLLSSREQQVLVLIRQGQANKEIAAELRLSEGTVKEYISNMMCKTGTRNRTDLAVNAPLSYEGEHYV